MLFRSIEEGAIVRDSIIMKDSVIRKGCQINKTIIAENVEIGENVLTGVGEFAESKLDKKVYAFDLVTIGENSYIPPNMKIGKNVAISGVTEVDDYNEGALKSGEYIIKAGEVR